MSQPPYARVNPASGNLIIGPGLETPRFQVASPDTLVVYASPAGNDANTGATPATAVQTLVRAAEVVESTGWNMSAQIRLLPGNYPVSGNSLSVQAVYGRQSDVALTITGDSLTTAATLSVVAVAGGATSPWLLTVSAPVTGALDGGQAEFLTGALAGQRILVGGAAGTALRLMAAGGAAPAPGDTFRVLVPNAVIDPEEAIIISSNNPVALVNLDIRPSAFLVLLSPKVIFLNGVRLLRHPSAPSALVEFLGRVLLGLPGDTMGINVGGPGVAFLGEPGNHLTIITPLGPSILAQGCLVQDCDAQLLPGTTASFEASLFLRSNVGAGGSVVQLTRCQALEAPGAGLQFDAATAQLSNCDVSACGGDGVSAVFTRLALSTVTSDEGPNGGTGLVLNAQVQAGLAGSGGGNTLTGGGGDVKVGDNAVATWATILSTPAARSDFGAASPQYSSLAL